MALFFAALALALLSAGWVVHPIVRRHAAPVADPLAGGILDAEARKRVALASLKEIEYDRLGGKLDEEDYRGLRMQLEREALSAIDAADSASGREAPPPESRPVAAANVATALPHSCGYTNPAGSRFCSGCGVPLA